MDVLEKIKSNGIVAVVRDSNMENIIPICEALFEGGIKTIEITAETPRVNELIEKANKAVGDKVLIGAGTVLDPETARSVIAAGAVFVVSPTLNVETIKMVKRYGVISIPGALTPTEILTAYEHGADMIKVFPASIGGPDYVSHIHGPLPHIPLLLSGGIEIDNIFEYVQGGASGISLGRSLVNPKKLNSETDYRDLVERAKNYVGKYKESLIK